MSVALKIHVGKAEGLVSDKKEGLDTYVKFEIEGQKAKIKSKVVQNSQDPIYDEDVVVDSPNPDADVLLITVVSKEVGRDENICDKVKIPVKEFLPTGKTEERVLDLKKKKKGVGKLYLTFVSSAAETKAEAVEGPIKKKSSSKDRKKSGDKDDKKKGHGKDKKEKKDRKGSSGDKKKSKKSSSDKKGDKKKKEELPVTYKIDVRCDNGENLVAADKGGVSDPYIVFRVEGSSKKVMNQCVENTVNPVWGDVVQVDGYAAGNDLLKITVMDKDHKQGSKNDDPIGYAEVEVRDIQPFGQSVQKRIPLRKVDKKGKPEKKSQPGDAGYINLTFHVHHEGTAPFTDEAWEFTPYNLRVKCIKAEDVPVKDLSGKSDPFLKCKIKGVPNSQEKKTKTDKQTLNPYWNEELYFKLNDPKTDVLKVTMLDEDKLSKADKMSKILLPLSEYPINQWVVVEKDMTPIGSATTGGLLFLEIIIETPNPQAPPPEPTPEPTPEPVQEERVVEVAPTEAKKSSSSSSSKKEGKCKFQWGSYSSSYSTSFSGYTEGKSLSALRSSEEKFHVHAEVKKVEYKPKPKGETLKGKVIEGKNLFQIEKFPGLEAYVEVKLVGKGKDKKGKTIQTDVLTVADAQWDKEFDFGRVKKGQAVEIILWMKHAALPEFSQYGYARVEVKNIAWDNEEPQTIQLAQPPKAGFLQRLASDAIEYGQVVVSFNHHIDQ